MANDKKKTPSGKENKQADTNSGVREGQENSSILHDRKDNSGNVYPGSKQQDRQFKEQDEFVHKKSNKTEDDE